MDENHKTVSGAHFASLLEALKADFRGAFRENDKSKCSAGYFVLFGEDFLPKTHTNLIAIGLEFGFHEDLNQAKVLFVLIGACVSPKDSLNLQKLKPFLAYETLFQFSGDVSKACHEPGGLAHCLLR